MLSRTSYKLGLVTLRERVGRSMQAVAADETRPSLVYGSGVRDYMGKSGQGEAGPQAYLVTCPSRIDPHFHTVDQFQVVVEGEGELGKKPMPPVSFHSTAAFTPCGPITAGEQGLRFFTLHRFAQVHTHFMPGSRDKLRQKAGRDIK